MSTMNRIKDLEALCNKSYRKGKTKSIRRPIRRPKLLEWTDVKVESRLGNGSFSNVFKVQIVDDMVRQNDKPVSYALKCLKGETVCCGKSFMIGAIDLSIEAQVLSSIRHENIVQLHAISKDCGNNTTLPLFCNENNTSSFIIIDLLEETLDKRIDVWREQELSYKKQKHSGTLSSLFNSKSGSTNSRSSVTANQRRERLVHRLESTMIGIARGMKCLHENNIIHRDLKPQNIGFAKDGLVRIFDFGLAKKIEDDTDADADEVDDHSCQQQQQKDQSKDKNSRKCEVAGTLKYMAPENYCRDVPSSFFPGDVYSFGILLYEICSLQIPYNDIKFQSVFIDKVMKGKHRPSLLALKDLPPVLKVLITSCWDPNPSVRPPFAKIVDVLERIITDEKESLLLFKKEQERAKDCKLDSSSISDKKNDKKNKKRTSLLLQSLHFSTKSNSSSSTLTSAKLSARMDSTKMCTNDTGNSTSNSRRRQLQYRSTSYRSLKTTTTTTTTASTAEDEFCSADFSVASSGIVLVDQMSNGCGKEYHKNHNPDSYATKQSS